MADVKISGLPASTLPLAGTEVLPIVQGGVTKQVTNNDLRPKQIQSNATSGVLQVVGPSAAATRVMTTPDANFTAARTDAAQSFTGDQTLSTGNLVIGTSGKGIDFSATPNTGTSELLADYEEGTYTPEISFSTLTSGITYTSRSGVYTKVGRVVSVTAYVLLSSIGLSTGAIFITLPFASSGLVFGWVGVDSCSGLSGTLGVYGNNTATCTITYSGTGARNNVASGNCTNITEVNVNITYIV
jgi:hypothetical protein